jgi:hypothetical protein
MSEETKPQQVLSVGRVVHVVTFNGKHRPAFVLDPVNNITIQVLAFTNPRDHINDQGLAGNGVAWLLDECPHDPTAQQPGSWHWPEYVPAK